MVRKFQGFRVFLYIYIYLEHDLVMSIPMVSAKKCKQNARKLLWRDGNCDMSSHIMDRDKLLFYYYCCCCCCCCCCCFLNTFKHFQL